MTNRPTYGGVALPDTNRRQTYVLQATEFDEPYKRNWDRAAPPQPPAAET
ncbi:hypothetical protein GCM10009839_00990 [Catenulispora yoronensis]|uniref:Uncharacterized protein n=1 Tax=Catenulispora yoronensis TaxID=450799 RepID=A0ABP5EY24_9ACTN